MVLKIGTGPRLFCGHEQTLTSLDRKTGLGAELTTANAKILTQAALIRRCE